MRRLAIGAVAALSLTACEIPVPQVSAAPDVQYPTSVTAYQSDAIVAETFAELAGADAAESSDAFGPRIGGDAADVRTAEYVLAGSGEPRTQFSDEMLAIYATNQQDWPRVFVGVAAPAGDALTPMVMVWEQDDLHAPYQLRYWAHMVPGAVLPAMPGQSMGTDVRDLEDGAGLAAVPAEVVADYERLLNLGEDRYERLQQDAAEELAAPPSPSPSASADAEQADDVEPRVPTTFAHDAYRERMYAARASLARAADARNGSYGDTVSARTDEAWVLATDEGGVLVLVPVDVESHFRVPGAQLILPASDRRLLSGRLQDDVTYHYRDYVVLHIPAADSDAAVGVVAADHHMTSIDA